jgi:coenzyme F420-reducing hydrogenase delta subunit/NAD-dependent dihydropyrimidine dehydrogenase PreA subunit
LHDQQGTVATIDFGAIIYAYDPESFEKLAVKEGRGIYFAAPDTMLAGSKAAALVMSELRRPWENMDQRAGDIYWDKCERMGILVCKCGGAISNHVDVQAVCEEAVSWPGVVYSTSLSHSCLPESSKIIAEIIETHQLDRVVLAACSCCTLDQVCDSCTYQRVRAKKNMGIFPRNRQQNEHMVGFRNFELVNIREQCAWVHSDDHAAATGKAIALVRAAAARAHVHDVQDLAQNAVEGRVLILGSGEAAAACRQTLAGLAVETDCRQTLPDEIKRSNGEYLVYAEGKALPTSSMVIAPASKTEEEDLLTALDSGYPAVIDAGRMDGLCSLKPGVLLCDPDAEPSLTGTAAAAQVIAWMGRMKSRGLQNTAFVNPSYCRACGTCMQICEYGAPELVAHENGDYVRIDPVICQGCGTCIAHCPSGAIQNQMSTDAQLAVSLKEMCKDEKWSQGLQRIIVLTCNWNGYQNLESAGKERAVYSPAFFPHRVSCLGEINAGSILQAFQHGADGVLMLGCKEDECHYCFGSRSAEDVFIEARELVRLLGYPNDSLKIVRLGVGEDVSFEDITNCFVSKLGEDTWWKL